MSHSLSIKKIQIEQNRCAIACQGYGAVFLKKAVASFLTKLTFLNYCINKELYTIRDDITPVPTEDYTFATEDMFQQKAMFRHNKSYELESLILTAIRLGKPEDITQISYTFAEKVYEARRLLHIRRSLLVLSAIIYVFPAKAIFRLLLKNSLDSRHSSTGIILEPKIKDALLLAYHP